MENVFKMDFSIETSRPLSFADIYVETVKKANELITYRVHCKYDTQATADAIIARLKRLQLQDDRFEGLETEIRNTKFLLESTSECYQEPIKAYLDGLNKAWGILNGNQ